MSLFSDLIKLYDSNQQLVGKNTRTDDNPLMLLPIGYQQNKAYLKIIINQNAELQSVESYGSKGINVALPVTSSSSVRTSSLAAHPLSDTLQYIGTGLVNHCKQLSDKESKKLLEANQLYLDQLADWSSKSELPALKNIYHYLASGKLIPDLIERKFLLTTSDGNVAVSKKEVPDDTELPSFYEGTAGEIYKKLITIDYRDLTEPPTLTPFWLRDDLKADFLQWQEQTLSTEDVSYISGKNEKLAVSFPKGIIKSVSGAKLLSTNDSNQFLGQFLSDSQAMTIGYEELAKATNSLKWIIEKQGTYIGNRVFVVWTANDDLKKPQILNLSFDLLDVQLDEPIENDEVNNDTGESYASGVNQTIKGKGNHWQRVAEDVHILQLDAATPGRLSILNYQTLSKEIFFERIDHWYTKTSWLYYDHISKAVRQATPKPSDIIKVVLNSGQLGGEAAAGALYSTIYNAILYDQRISENILNAVYQRVLNVVGYDVSRTFIPYANALSIACSLIKNFYQERNYTEMLEKDNHERSYLFGRLLAVAKRIESLANYQNQTERVQTNADRYMQAFATRPASTWKIIYLAVQPYLKQIKGSAHYFDQQIQEIMSLLSSDEMTDVKLEPTFLIGYYHQQQVFFDKKEKSDKEEVINDDKA